jgi:hypothetical protein
MSFAAHSGRFNLHWLFPAIETNGDTVSEAPISSLFSSNEDLTSDLNERDFDLALAQVSSQRYCVCPLCGAIVGSDGSVLR